MATDNQKNHSNNNQIVTKSKVVENIYVVQLRNQTDVNNIEKLQQVILVLYGEV
jgi:hypothetical protein